MSTSTPTLADRVAKGAAWLDRNRPGWFKKINLERLDILDGCGCVLAQSFKAHFCHVMDRIGFDAEANVEHGFHAWLGPTPEQMEADEKAPPRWECDEVELREHWVTAILHRRFADAESPRTGADGSAEADRLHAAPEELITVTK